MVARVAAEALTVRAGRRTIISGIDIHMDAGQALAVLGPSGSGKTTLLRALHGLLPLDAGQVLVDASPMPVRGAGRRTMLRRFGYVQQDPGLLRGTPRTNLAFRHRSLGRVPDPRAIDAALHTVGLTERADGSVGILSGGERQRLALARALLGAPDVLFLDEFTNQVDDAWARRMEALVSAEMERGAAVVLVSHDAAQAERLGAAVVRLADGTMRDA